MKHNKTWYNNRINEAKRNLEELQSDIEHAEAAEDFDGINRLYDQEWEIREEINSLDRECSTRQWNAQDLQQHALIAQNID